MSPESSLRVIVDGDSSKVYHGMDQVTGRILLAVEHQEEIESLKVNFVGSCVTKTRRPFRPSNKDATTTDWTREYEEHIDLFKLGKSIVIGCTFQPNKYSWTFDFAFPELTQPQYSRLARGSKYLRDPHPLPPSFKLHTNSPKGVAVVSYYIQASLTRKRAKTSQTTSQVLPYYPTSHDISLEPRVASRILYAQIWKPIKDNRKTIDKIFTKVRDSTLNNNILPRIVPTIYHPERIAPEQPISLFLLLENTEVWRIQEEIRPQCILDSLKVTISTHSNTLCAQTVAQPEVIATKHITCISKKDINRAINFRSPVKLTNNLRLVDDAECIPSFKTYTIARRYTLTIVVGIKYEDQRKTFRCTTPLEILPRIPRELLPQASLLNDETDVDPLPPYEPREPSREFAPDYESLYSLSPTHSRSVFSATAWSRSSSLASGISTPATSPSTPAHEIDQPTF